MPRRLQSVLRRTALIVLLSVISAPGSVFATRGTPADEAVNQSLSVAGPAAGRSAPTDPATTALMPRGAIVPEGRGAPAASERQASPDFHWLRHINAVRAGAGLLPVVEEAEWSIGSMLHSRYMVKNNYVGHDEETGNPWYTPEGRAAGLHGNAYANYRFDEPEQHGIDAWLTTPFHLINVLDPRLTRTGFGWYRESQEEGYQIGATLDVARGIDPDRGPVRQPVYFPADGRMMPFSRYFGVEYPDPLTSCPDRAFQGAPIMVQLPATPEVSLVTLVKDGLRLDRCVFDETTYMNADPASQVIGRDVLAGRHAVTIMPREPLTPGIYQVSVISGGATYAWSFAGPGSVRTPMSARTDAAASPHSTSQQASGAMTSLAFPMRAPSCSSRQDAGVGVVRQGADRLLTIVAARGANNLVRQLHFGLPSQPLENATIELEGYPAPITRQGTVTLPAETTRVSFAVQRVASGQPMRAPFTITDACGDWPTSVEAGATSP